MKQKSPSLVKNRAHHLQCESVANKEQQNEWVGRGRKENKTNKFVGPGGGQENEKNQTQDAGSFTF